MPGPGKKFEKGQSGNWAGRPKTFKHLRDELRKHEPAFVARLVGIAKDGKDADAIQAIKLALAYMYGQPSQKVDLGGGSKNGAFRLTLVRNDAPVQAAYEAPTLTMGEDEGAEA